jgi:hypothetical protein
MDGWIYILLVFILAGMVVIVIAILVGERTKANLRLPGRARLSVQVDKGWRKPPRRKPSGKPAGRDRHGKSRGSPIHRAYRTWLTVKGSRWEFPLDGKRIIYVGRRDDNDIVLRDRTADTRQAVIYWEDERYKINNRSSRMPTRVNHRPITKQNLGDGCTIQMGRTRLIFRQKRA